MSEEKEFLVEENRLLKVCHLLNQEKCQYLIIGGMALNLHGVLRATKDVDVLIPKDLENTKKVLGALSRLAFGIADELDAKQVNEKPITIVGDMPRVDILTIANKVKYEDAICSSLNAEVAGVKIPYVDEKTLIKTKKTDRLQDLADIEKLEKIKKKP